MGLSWQQGPLSPGAIGRFLVPESLPKRVLYAEPLRRRMRVRFGGTWIADSENVSRLPGRPWTPSTKKTNGTTGEEELLHRVERHSNAPSA